jgi:radical SAM protein with 4Fe4S-binding SPASM domain
MQQVSYKDFSASLHDSLFAQRIPINGTIEITRRCPLSCLHCYNNLPVQDQAARSSELSYEEHRRIVDEIAEAGCLWLLYTGGEIFARKDFLDIYTHAKRQGLLITLFTNGTLITPKIADHLTRYRPFGIEITLYGRTKETYERLTGVPGSYDKCLQGIHLLMERKLPLKLKTVAVTVNKHEVWDMKRFAEEELGLEFKFDAMMNPRIDCSQSPLAVRLSAEEAVLLDLQDPGRIESWKKFGSMFNGPVHSAGHDTEVYHCGGGLSSFAVDPQGQMSICVLSQVDKYDLRSGTFKNGWEHFLLNARRKKTTMLTKCASCHIKAICGMCPANGELENGHAEKPVDFLCQAAHLRAHLLGFAIPAHGDCEYCEGGNKHADLVRSVTALRSGNLQRAQPTLARDVLPILSEQATSGGCSSGGCRSCNAAG